MRIINHTKLPTMFLRRLALWAFAEDAKSRTDVLVFRYAGLNRTDYTRTRFTGSHRLRYVDVPRAEIESPDGQDNEFSVRHVQRIVLEACASASRLDVSTLIDIYRQPIGPEFMAKANELIASWRKGVKPPDPHAAQRTKVKTAEATLRAWERKLKFAQTKVKIWKRRQAAAARALAQRETVAVTEVLHA